jgi:DNA-binding beta-propeller fold protein YncE
MKKTCFVRNKKHEPTHLLRLVLQKPLHLEVRMGTTLSVQRSYSCAGIGGHGVCVASRHGLVIVLDSTTMQLHMYSLADGSLVRSTGARGRGKGQFDLWRGGLCVSPDGDSVLVAEANNNRVQQVRIVDGSWVRFVGEGVLAGPQYLDCNADVIAVSEWCHRISVLSWADGSVRAQFGSDGRGLGQLDYPRGVRLLADGSELVVADSWNNRLCVFTRSGGFVAAVGSREQGLHFPFDVLECVSDGSFVVANYGSDNLIKLSRDGAKVKADCKGGIGSRPLALAELPGGAMLVRHCDGSRCSVIRDQRHRLEWIGACVSAASV